jgi:DNA-3-methyladenine glycosylase II
VNILQQLEYPDNSLVGSTIRTAERYLSVADPVMAKLIDRFGPCTLKPQRPYFFVLCDAIISQQLSVKAATTIVRRFRSLYPSRFPSPFEVISTPDEQMRAIGISWAKAAYIKSLAEKFHTRAITSHRLARLKDEDIISELITVKGIGRWTAEMFLIFSLNRLDILPVADLGLQRGVQIHYGIKELPTTAQLIEVAASWQPYRTIATWYMWRSQQ